MRTVTALLLLMAGAAAGAQSPFAGDWQSQAYTMSLTVSGTTVTGSFRATSGDLQGTVQGQVIAGGQAVRLGFSYRRDDTDCRFDAQLVPAVGGRLLTGNRWGEDEVLTALGFHKGGSVAAGDLLTEESPLIPTGSGAVTTPPTDTGRPAGEAAVIFEIGNIARVGNRPTSPSRFTTTQAYWLTQVTTYHWNGGRGAKPGTIALKSKEGKLYGPWPAKGLPGMGGCRNAGWLAAPDAALPPGTYTVIDSNPATWSQNPESGGRGFVKIEGLPMPGETPKPPRGDPVLTNPTPPTSPGGKLSPVVCAALQDDKPVAPATRFQQPKTLYCWAAHQDLPETVVTCEWLRGGQVVTSSQRTLKGTGWVWFSLATTSPTGLTKGSYSVRLRSAGGVLGQQDFVVE